jgi:dienelactone hydrolase
MLRTDSVKSFDTHRAALALFFLFVLGCSSPTQRSDREAQRAGLSRSIVQGTTFRHVVYSRVERPVTTLTVYLEGDGLPWEGGRIPASDPTPRDPLALQLMAQSSEPALYVGRPCYYELHDVGCSAQAWTFARYSSAAVESMAAAITAQASQVSARDVRLIGYSGGGVLAVLIAERLQNVSSVITLAANLDVSAWAAHHGYLPLHDSLNPALSTEPHRWRELHLHGVKDTVVPIATTRAYFQRYPAARQIRFDEYDHVCCWLRDWRDLSDGFRKAEGMSNGK